MSEKLEVKETVKIRKKIYSMILPLTIDNTLQMAAGLISMGMIGRIPNSEIAISAFAIGNRITQVIWALFKGIATGATVFVAQAYGADDIKKLKQVIVQALLSSLILVVALQQLIYWNSERILQIVFHPNEVLLKNGADFLRTVSWGLPFLVIMLLVGGALQGMGNAKTPMFITLIMNFTNIIFGWLFIFGKGGLSPLGIKGAAIATVIAQFIAAVIGIYILFNKKGILASSNNRGLIKPDLPQIGQIYRVGLPSSAESIFWQISAIILTNIVLSFGDVATSAYQLGLQAESISYMPAAGFGIAATAFIGQAVGAQNRELGKKYLKEIIIGAAAVTVFTASILVFVPRSLMGLLTDNKQIIDLGIKYLILMGLVQMPQNISGVLNGALRGAGFTWVPMFVSFVGIWIVRIPFSLILTNVYHMSVVAVWTVMCLDLVIRFFLSFYLYRTRDLYKSSLLSGSQAGLEG